MRAGPRRLESLGRVSFPQRATRASERDRSSKRRSAESIRDRSGRGADLGARFSSAKIDITAARGQVSHAAMEGMENRRGRSGIREMDKNALIITDRNAISGSEAVGDGSTFALRKILSNASDALSINTT